MWSDQHSLRLQKPQHKELQPQPERCDKIVDNLIFIQGMRLPAAAQPQQPGNTLEQKGDASPLSPSKIHKKETHLQHFCSKLLKLPHSALSFNSPS